MTGIIFVLCFITEMLQGRDVEMSWGKDEMRDDRAKHIVDNRI